MEECGREAVSLGPRLAVEDEGAEVKGEAGKAGWRLRADECQQRAELMP
jgi:hypothetical protein